MIILSYDISDDKLRARFAKYILKFGHRIQYSVYEIDNSKHILDNIICEIQNHFMKKFDQSDSILILELTSSCKVIKMGYAANEYSDMVIV